MGWHPWAVQNWPQGIMGPRLDIVHGPFGLGPKGKRAYSQMRYISPLWFIPDARGRDQGPTSYCWPFLGDANCQSLIRDKTSVICIEKWDDSLSHQTVIMMWRFVYWGHACSGYEKVIEKVFPPKYSFIASWLPLPYKLWPSPSQPTMVIWACMHGLLLDP